MTGCFWNVRCSKSQGPKRSKGQCSRKARNNETGVNKLKRKWARVLVEEQMRSGDKMF